MRLGGLNGGSPRKGFERQEVVGHRQSIGGEADMRTAE
jgi:hypothetical protein